MLTILFIFSYLFISNNKGKVKVIFFQFLREWKIVAFLFCLAFILTSTMFSRPLTTPYKNIYEDFGLIKDGKLNIEFIENALLYIPYVFFYLMAFQPIKPIKSGLIISVATTLFVELSQLIFWLGEFQFSDIVHNIYGGMIGCGLYYLVKKMIKSKKL